MYRRALLKRATGVAAVVGLAGCSQQTSTKSSPSTTEPRVLDRIVLRSDTDQTESLGLTLKYVDPDGDKHRPLWGTYTAPESGDLAELEDFDGHPGVYSLTVHSREHGSVDTRVVHATRDDDLQIEAVVQDHGAVWTNIGTAGDEISIPGYNPDDTEP